MSGAPCATVPAGGRRLRLLVAIASHGTRNLPLLQRVIEGYRALCAEVDLVVLSDAPKQLGPHVHVLVGAPSRNPWSLPFAHKRLFVQALAETVDPYDLFAYSEDDIEFTQRHLDAFLRLAPRLAPDEVAGFMRYEVDAAGRRWLPDVHGSHRWLPESVRRRGAETVAAYTNAHAAFYLLTRAQLQAAVASGGFERRPSEGDYDMLCTAATDPYTRCGLQKLVCVSAIDDFLLHHLSDRYAGRMGQAEAAFRAELRTLRAIGREAHPATSLLPQDGTLERRAWSKRCHDAAPREDLLALVPARTRSLLSVGCGDGATEARLLARGVHVTALPIDSVLGAVAAARGIEVVHGPLEAALQRLAARRFDCVLASELLHLVPDPAALLARCAALVAPGGAFVADGPHFGNLRLLTRRALGRGETRRLRSYRDGGISVVGPGAVARGLRDGGFRTAALRWSGSDAAVPARRWAATRWLLLAERVAPQAAR